VHELGAENLLVERDRFIEVGYRNPDVMDLQSL